MGKYTINFSLSVPDLEGDFVLGFGEIQGIKK
jgi:hypothetical protein